MNYIADTNRIYANDENGVLIAEVTFPKTGDNTVDIDHTFVDGSLRGQGVAGKLLELAAKELRSTGRKAVLSCSYAIKWFEKHPEEADLLV